jgi:hypothetical protein
VVEARNKAGTAGISGQYIFAQNGATLVPMLFQSISNWGLPGWNMLEMTNST